MNALVTAELVKARATRSVWLLGAVAVAMCLGWAVVDVLVWADGPVTREVEDAYSMAQQGYLVAMILGLLTVTGEYRHQTITWAVLVTPSRGLVITAKLLAAGVLGLVLGVATAVATAGVTAVLLATQGDPVLTGGVPLVLAGSVASTALWCVFGAALGALVRNQTVGITVLTLWFFYAEWFLVMLTPEIGRWTPTGVAKAVSGWSRASLPVPGELLPTWAGGLAFLGYTLVVAVLAHRFSVRRDIT